MKRMLVLLLLTVFNASAQHEYDNWYFGQNAAISFAGGIPTNLPNGAMFAFEGCSAISDSAGNLLFYTNGISVYDANHQQMPNGFNLKGGYSSTQAALVVKDPAAPHLFYIFTTSDMGVLHGLCYSKVDMTLNGGLGDVTVKNFQLLASSDEKVAAVTNATNDGYWVLTHKQPTGYYAFQVTAAGVGAPVVSNVGTLNTAEDPKMGHLKFSPNGSRIANCLNEYCGIEIADFDNATGTVSNPFVYQLPFANNQIYGAEFSASGNFLYFCNASPYSGFIYQLNLSVGDSTSVTNSATLIFNDPINKNGAMQRGPDNKIYVAHANSSTNFLGVINEPDSVGLACSYVSNGFPLNTLNQSYGLPNFMARVGGSWSPTLPPTATFNADNEVCQNGCITFDGQTTTATSYEWLFQGGTPGFSSVSSPTVCYEAAGTYDVSLIVANAAGSDTVVMSAYVTVSSPLAVTIVLSNDTLFGSSVGSYQWYLNSDTIPDADEPFYVPTIDGFYTAGVTDSNDCIALSAPLAVVLYQQPAAAIQPLTINMCPDSCTAINNQSTNATNYEWFFQGGNPSYSTDENPTNICYSTSGNYDVTLIAHNGPYSDTTVSTSLIQVYAPPSPTLVQSNDTILIGNPQAGDSYQWSLNGNVVSGATNHYFVPTESGVALVSVTNQQNCSSTASLGFHLGINDNSGEPGWFHIYPNPADALVTLSLAASKNATVTVCNTVGQVVYHALASGETTIDVSGFSGGLYLLHVRSDNETGATKLTVAR